MSDYIIHDSTLSGIADAIREKTGRSDAIPTVDMANEIMSISGGSANIWIGTQAELEEEFDELEDGTQINITDDEQGSVDGGDVYSDNEQCIGLWRNNKPLYQKTIDCGALPNNTIKYVSTGFASGVIDIVELSGYARRPSDNCIVPLPRVSTGTGDLIDLISIQNDGYEKIRIVTAANYSTFTESFVTIKYTKTADAPLDVTIGKPTVYIASSDCYSTEEKEVGCAPNGKPLYQKTILHENPFTGSESLQTIAHGISNFDEAVSITGFIYDAHESTPSWMPMPRFYTSNVFGISHVTTSDIYIYIPSAFGTRLRNARITIQYTKTTDTAGSGQYTPASGKAVHYSTDEQVIGTWIDGSTLYRKTIHKVNTAVINGTEIAHGISNLAMCTKLDVICYDESGTSFPIMAIGSQYADNSSERSMGFRVNATNFVAYGKNEFAAQTTRHWYFTVEYTKSA